MSTQTKITSETATEHNVVRRYWRLRDKRGGWWPWGWLLLLALLLLFLYGLFVTAPAIENETAQRVREVLAERGVSDLSVETDGQEVLIYATGSAADGERIRAWARDVVCETWAAGWLICPSSVRVQMKAATSPAAAEAQPAKRWHDFRFEKANGSIILKGEVPDAKTRDELVAKAKSRYANVIDQLRTTGDLATNDYDWAADQAMLVLFAMESGHADWTAGKLSAKGTTAATKEAEVRRMFASGDQPERLGSLDLQITVDADHCNKAFAERLAASTIRFQTGSAEIASDSRSLIVQLADLAKACPTELAVEGHTDNIGPAQLNRDLSQARAEAVVEALVGLGVDSERLTPRGFGADRPIADNSTVEGRAQNRRIEIRVIPSPNK